MSDATPNPTKNPREPTGSLPEAKKIKPSLSISSDLLSLFGTDSALHAVHQMCWYYALREPNPEQSFWRLMSAFARSELSRYKVVRVDDFEADGFHATLMMDGLGVEDVSAIRVVKKAFQQGGKEQIVGAKIARLFAETSYTKKVTYDAVSVGDEPEFVDTTDETVFGILEQAGFKKDNPMQKPVMLFLSCPLYELQSRFFHCLRQCVGDSYEVKVVLYSGAFNVAGLVRTIKQQASDNSPVDSVHVFNRFAFDFKAEQTQLGKPVAFPSNLDGLDAMLKSDALDGPHLDQVRALNTDFVAEKAARGSEWVRGCDLVQNLYQKKDVESDSDFEARIARVNKCWSVLDTYITDKIGACPGADKSAQDRADWGAQSVLAMREFFFGLARSPEALYLLTNGYVSARRQNMINGHPVIADQLMLAGPMLHSEDTRYERGMPVLVEKAGRVVGLDVKPADADYKGCPFYMMTLRPVQSHVSTERALSVHLDIARGLWMLGNPATWKPTDRELSLLNSA